MVMKHEAAVADDGVRASSLQIIDSFLDPLLELIVHNTLLARHEVESGDLFVDHIARERVGIADVAESIFKVRVVKHEHAN